MRQLPLHAQHEAHGARFAPYGEWLLPESYLTPDREYRAAREKVALIDLSHDGRYLLYGEDRTGFLQNLMSQDIHHASAERGIYSTFLTAKGKMLSDFYLYSLHGAYFFEIESVITEKTLQQMMRFKFRSKINIETPRWGKLVVAGPLAKPFLAERMRLPSGGERSFLSFDTDPLLVIQRTYTGEDDYTLYGHEAHLSARFSELLSAGQRWGISLIGQTTLNQLRIEAGQPRYGAELDENRIPIEAGLEADAISYTKGCYPGQEVIARIKTYGHVNWHLMGLVLQGPTAPRHQDRIFSGENEVGWVTSGVYSPFCKVPIAMAYLRTEAAHAGKPVEVLIQETRVPAVVTALPFYKRQEQEE